MSEAFSYRISHLTSSNVSRDTLHVMHIFLIEAVVTFTELSLRAITNATSQPITCDYVYLVSLAYSDICWTSVSTRVRNRLWMYEAIRCDDLTPEFCQLWASGDNVKNQVFSIMERKKQWLGLGHLP